MAAKIPNLSNVRILDLNASKQAIDAVKDPNAKFQILDELTGKELTPSVAFQVLTKAGKDPSMAQHAGQNYFTLGPLTNTYVNRLIHTVENSVELSNHLMSSIGNHGKNQLSSVCTNVNTYIHTKLFHAIYGILSLPNFSAYCAKETHPLYPIHKMMEQLQEHNHGQYCPCYNHIQAHLAAPIQNEASPQAAATCITVKYDHAGPRDKLFIRGNGCDLSWNKGVELKKTGTNTWIFETQKSFANLEYKILINDDNNRWEKGDNHKIESRKKEEIRPQF